MNTDTELYLSLSEHVRVGERHLRISQGQSRIDNFHSRPDSRTDPTSPRVLFHMILTLLLCQPRSLPVTSPLPGLVILGSCRLKLLPRNRNESSFGHSDGFDLLCPVDRLDHTFLTRSVDSSEGGDLAFLLLSRRERQADLGSSTRRRMFGTIINPPRFPP